jgi:hypothetical protein
MFANLNVFFAGLGLAGRLFGLLLLPWLVPLVGAGFKTGGPLGPLLLYTVLPWLVAALPLAWLWARHGLSPARRRPGERSYFIGHALIALANAVMLAGLLLAMSHLLSAPTGAPRHMAPMLLWLGRFPSEICWLLGIFLVWHARAVPAAQEPPSLSAPSASAQRAPASAKGGKPTNLLQDAGATRLPRWLSVARALAVVNAFLAFMAVPLVLGLMAYGLAHASDGAGAQALLLIVAAAAVLVIGPLAVFAPNRWTTVGPALRALGVVFLLVSTVVVAAIAWPTVLQPAWMAHRFKTTVEPLTVVRFEHEPVLLQGAPVGLKTTLHVNLPKPLPLDRYGQSVFELLHSAYLAPADPSTGSRATPFAYSFSQPRAEVRLGDTLVETRRRTDADTAKGQQTPDVLQAGVYRVTQVHWLVGLGGTDANEPPCRSEAILSAGQLDELRRQRSFRLVGKNSVRFALNLRNGYRHHTISSEPFDFAHDHDAWVAALAALPLEACNARDARLRSEKLERQVAAGDPALSWQDNPLTKALCAHDAAAVRTRLALGPPKFNVARMMLECKVGADQPELFDLMMPVLYARESEREDYCRMLEPWLRQRQLAPLHRLRMLELPVMCARARQFQALLDESSLRQPLTGAVLVPWMQQIETLGARLCEPSPSDNNLLQHAVGTYDAELINFLLDRQCDPGLMPSLDKREWGDKVLMSTRLKWRLRTMTEKGPGKNRFVEELDADTRQRLQARIGDVTTLELARVDPSTGNSLLSIVGEPAFTEPKVLAWLVGSGARLDATLPEGYSWYLPGYKEFDFYSVRTEVLDVLDDEQLRLMLKPAHPVTGKPGLPLDRVSERGGKLGSYLCQRKVMAC